MPRRPHIPKRSEEEVETFARLAAAAEDPLPHEPDLLRKLLTAVLTRLYKKDVTEAKFLEHCANMHRQSNATLKTVQNN